VTQYRKELLAPTTTPISWDIWAAADFDVWRITLVFSALPSDIANVEVWLIDHEDPTYNVKLQVIDPNEALTIAFQCTNNIQGRNNGNTGKSESLRVIYANNQQLNIRGKAMVEV